MKLQGLKFEGIKVLKGADVAKDYKTHSIGDGLWSIEIFDRHGNFVKEFVGENGTRDEPTDLWAQIDEWEKELFCKFRNYSAPDGACGSYSHFLREVEKGRLHGLVVVV